MAVGALKRENDAICIRHNNLLTIPLDAMAVFVSVKPGCDGPWDFTHRAWKIRFHQSPARNHRLQNNTYERHALCTSDKHHHRVGVVRSTGGSYGYAESDVAVVA
jgi:hypothetical protein